MYFLAKIKKKHTSNSSIDINLGKMFLQKEIYNKLYDKYHNNYS